MDKALASGAAHEKVIDVKHIAVPDAGFAGNEKSIAAP
jgi:hypothetical protein